MNLHENIRNDLKLFETEDRAGMVINYDDPSNPEVRVSGFGDMLLHQLEASIQDKLVNLVERGNESNYETINWAIYEQGTLKHFLKAILEINDEILMDKEEIKQEGMI